MSTPATFGPGADPLRPARHLQPGDGWVECSCGRRHWGLVGAAGLLLVRFDAADAPEAVVLQHRALWSDQGGTWGVPGGALAPGESALDGALRESGEEAGITPESIQVIGSTVLDHTDWRYTTIVARAVGAVDPRPTDAESLDIRWVEIAEVAERPLLPAFADAWPRLLELAGTARGGGDPIDPQHVLETIRPR